MTAVDIAPVRTTVRVDVEHRPGAVTLLGGPATGGLVWAARFPSRSAAIVALLRRALSTDEPGDADA